MSFKRRIKTKIFLKEVIQKGIVRSKLKICHKLNMRSLKLKDSSSPTTVEMSLKKRTMRLERTIVKMTTMSRMIS